MGILKKVIKMTSVIFLALLSFNKSIVFAFLALLLATIAVCIEIKDLIKWLGIYRRENKRIYIRRTWIIGGISEI